MHACNKRISKTSFGLFPCTEKLLNNAVQQSLLAGFIKSDHKDSLKKYSLSIRENRMVRGDSVETFKTLKATGNVDWNNLSHLFNGSYDIQGCKLKLELRH